MDHPLRKFCFSSGNGQKKEEGGPEERGWLPPGVARRWTCLFSTARRLQVSWCCAPPASGLHVFYPPPAHLSPPSARNLAPSPSSVPGRGGRDSKKKDTKKEDRAAFLARTQAQRESRQTSRAENNAATHIAAMLRRSRDLTTARRALLARLDEAIRAGVPAPTWRDTADFLRLVCLARCGGPTRAELSLAVKALLTALTTDSGDDSYAQQGVHQHLGVMHLQLKRICVLVIREMVRCRWTTLPSAQQAEDAAMLKALFVLTDAAQWKAVAGVPAAAKMCAEVVGSLVVPLPRGSCARGRGETGAASSGATWLAHGPDGHGLYGALRQVLCPSGDWPGVKDMVQAPLLWTLVIRPLTSGFPAGDARQVWVAYKFALEILSIPALCEQVPAVLLPAVLHQSVWPRVVFSLGTAAKIHPPGAPSVSAWLPEDRILDVLCNLTQLAAAAQHQQGLQLLYLSALKRLVEALPADALSRADNASKLKMLAPMQSPNHIQWLLCGLGGASEGEAAGGESIERLRTWTYVEWTRAYREVRVRKNTAGKPQFAEGMDYFCSVLGILLRAWPAGNIQMLNAMSFDSPVHVALWAWLRASGLLQDYIDHGTEPQLVGAVVFLFCRCYLHRLMVTDDSEFYEQQTPFPLPHLVDLALLLRQYVNRRFWAGEVEGGSAAARAAASGGKASAVREMRQLHREAATGLLHQLYDRNARREFCPLDTWLQKGMQMDAFGISSTDEDSRTLVILREFPHVIPLHDRVRKFQELIEQDRQASALPETHVKIRRQHVVEDGFSKLGGFRSELKGVVKVHFVNESGIDEAGIDMGGLYKEFLTTLIERAFHPDYGLFRYPHGLVSFFLRHFVHVRAHLWTPLSLTR